MAEAVNLTIKVNEDTRVSALWLRPPDARAVYVFAHGAGAGMHHRSMSSVAGDLAEQGVATLRYQFPYMERGSKRPDAPAACHATVRAAVAVAKEIEPDLPVFAGGRSFGGRMTSQTCAAGGLLPVRGLIFLAYPLHPAGSPSNERAAHLAQVDLPMLFVQGTNDALASLDLLEGVIDKLGSRATLHRLQGADHAFHVPARSGRNDGEVRAEAIAAMTAWVANVSISRS